MAKTLKEITIELLEKYEASENVAICEYSTNINKDMDLLDKEVKKYRRMIEDADRKTEIQSEVVNDSQDLVKDLVKAFCEDGTWLECQGVYTLTLAEAKQRAVDIIESVIAKTEPRTCDNCGTPRDKCVYCIEEDRMWTPQTERSSE